MTYKQHLVLTIPFLLKSLLPLGFLTTHIPGFPPTCQISSSQSPFCGFLFLGLFLNIDIFGNLVLSLLSLFFYAYPPTPREDLIHSPICRYQKIKLIISNLISILGLDF